MTKVIFNLGWVLIGFFTFSQSTLGLEKEKDQILERWLTKQTNITSFKSDFIQKRIFKSLAEPLISRGEIWFNAPGLFRWELGTPAQTIAIRNTNGLTILYPKLKRAENYSFADDKQNQWKDALSLLEAGFPRSKPEMEKSFELISLKDNSDHFELTMQPRSSMARKMMPTFKISFSNPGNELRSTTIVFADGSSIENLFTNLQSNISISNNLFSADIPPGYKIKNPLAGQ